MISLRLFTSLDLLQSTPPFSLYNVSKSTDFRFLCRFLLGYNIKFLLVGGEMNLSWERDFSLVGEGGMSKYLVIGSPLFLSRENPV